MWNDAILIHHKQRHQTYLPFIAKCKYSNLNIAKEMIPCNKFLCVHKKCTYAHTERQLATQLQYFEGIVNTRKELKKNVKSANNFKRIAKKIFPMVEQLHTNTQLQSTGKLLSFLQQTSVFTDKERGNMLKVMLDCQHEVSNKNKDAFPMPNQKTEPPVVTTSFAAESSVFLVSPMKKNPPPGLTTTMYFV